MVKYITQETGVSEKKARRIWSFVFEKYHSYMSDVWNELDEHIELINDIIN